MKLICEKTASPLQGTAGGEEVVVNLRDLRYLLAIAEHRHFGRAADACQVSQPTLSGQLKRVEECLGVTLFERTRKLVVPTEVGERILDYCRQAVAAADAIGAAIVEGAG